MRRACGHGPEVVAYATDLWLLHTRIGQAVIARAQGTACHRKWGREEIVDALRTEAGVDCIACAWPTLILQMLGGQAP